MIPSGTKLPLHFAAAERNLIQKHTFFDPDFGNFAVAEGGSIRLDKTLEDIEDLQG